MKVASRYSSMWILLAGYQQVFIISTGCNKNTKEDYLLPTINDHPGVIFVRGKFVGT